MKKYIFYITQCRKGGEPFSQKVWVKATSRDRAEDEVRSEYWGIVDITLLSEEKC